MFFALKDYLNYKNKTGRFSRNYKASDMGAAFQGQIPQKALNLLSPGDVIFFQTLNCWISWLIMYLTKSEISHVAIYTGNNLITHTTLSGVISEPIQGLFDENIRLLPCIVPLEKEHRKKVLPLTEEILGSPYSLASVIKKSFRIINGRDWYYFRFSFILDATLILLAIDIPIIFFTGHFLFSWLLIFYLICIPINGILHIIKPLKFNENTAKPIEFFDMFVDQGASLLFDGYELSKQQKANNKIKDG